MGSQKIRLQEGEEWINNEYLQLDFTATVLFYTGK